jgi:hypothetical protein
MAIADRIAAVTRAKPKVSVAKRATDERRWARRKPGVVGGMIAYHPVKAPVSCIVRDMSATGAKLEIESGWNEGINSAEDVPDEITLLVRIDKIEVDCVVIWRKAKSLGVRFKGGMRPLSRRLTSRNVQPPTASK